MSTAMFRTASLVLVLALVGCGEKKPPTTDPTTTTAVVNPKTAFAAGVKLIDAATPNWAAAATQFEAATTADPNYAKAWYNLGYTSERNGDLAKAEGAYRKAVELDAAYTNATINLAGVLVKAGKAADAVTVYKAYVDAHPDDLAIRNNLVDALGAAKLYDEAVAQAQEILGRDPKNVGAYRNLSRIYYDQGNFAMSQLCAEKARTLSDTDPGIYNNRGVTYLAQKNEPKAIEEFKTAIKLDPGNVEANLNLGYLAANSGDFQLALSCFEAVVKQSPGNLDAQLGYAIALRGMKDYEAAEKVYEGLLTKDPTNRTVVFNASTLQVRYVKNFKKAQTILEDFQKRMAGQLSPSDELYVRLDEVKKLQAEYEEQERAKAAAAKEAAEREERAKKLLSDMDALVKAMEADLQACPGIDPMVQEEVMMVLEQTKPVLEEKDTSLASEMKTFVDDAKAKLDAAKAAACGGGGGAAPTEGTPATPPAGTTPAPTEGGTTPPADPTGTWPAGGGGGQ